MALLSMILVHVSGVFGAFLSLQFPFFSSDRMNSSTRPVKQGGWARQRSTKANLEWVNSLKTIYVSAMTKEGKEVDPFGLDMVQCYEDALLEAEKRGIRVKALLLSNPHNPFGE